MFRGVINKKRGVGFEVRPDGSVIVFYFTEGRRKVARYAIRPHAEFTAKITAGEYMR